MDNIYKDIEEYNPNEKRKISIIFDDVIADMLSKEKLYPIQLKNILQVEN